MNKFLLQNNFKIFVQGATGREGRRAVSFMKNYGTSVVAGITPKKGGQDVERVPIVDTVKEARALDETVVMTSIYVPPLSVKDAVVEAIENGITFIHVLTENAPLKDLAYIQALSNNNDVTLLGPGSLGFLVVDRGRVGMLGGPNPQKEYLSGSVSIISRSGGMTNEIAHYLLRHGIGLRTLIHLGSEPMIGLSLTTCVQMALEDRETKFIVIFEEVTSEEQHELSMYCREAKPIKPIFMIVSGVSQACMPQGVPFGHATALKKKAPALLEKEIKDLEQSGIILLSSYEELVRGIKPM